MADIKGKVIDWKRKGNVIRFFIGSEDLKDWWGDDWNDKPYEYNAGKVYDEFIIGVNDIVFPFDDKVLTPDDNWEYHIGTPYDKNSFKTQHIPFLIHIPASYKKEFGYSWDFLTYNEVVEDPRFDKYYMGMPMNAIADYNPSTECIVPNDTNQTKEDMHNIDSECIEGKIIDFDKKGNLVRFFVGAKELNDWGGDDWNDTPYEHNAGRVADSFIIGVHDIAFPFDDDVLSPEDDWTYEGNSPYCKDDFKAGIAPCIVDVPAEYKKSIGWEWDELNFSYIVGAKNVNRYYFGDLIEVDKIYNPDKD